MKPKTQIRISHALTLTGFILVVVGFLTFGCISPGPSGTPTTQPISQSFGAAVLKSQVKLLITEAAVWVPAEDQPYVEDAAKALANLNGASADATPEQQQALVDALTDAEARLLRRVEKAKTGK